MKSLHGWQSAPGSTLVSLLLLLLPSVAIGCECRRYRCRRNNDEYVYAVQEMLSIQAQWCINNNSAYVARGSCRYCPTDCQDDVCNCSSSSSCDWLSTVGAICCFLLAVPLIGIAIWASCRHCKMRNLVRAYETEMGNKRLDPWERKVSVSIVLPCVGAVVLVGAGVAVWMTRTRIDV